ncbi:sulfatase-like hydrolase/transferase [Psychrobacter sp. Sarcosine-3u-12]|uniref:sulfatase-like hydrolase/transferase n=1 Tax=Psychrobacter sp. Sarcosine-3u-12 TaxID=2058325 RepID=UPI000C334E0C|nr:sulfatase-like hydrolase/transferase [Psychrobacter sp. Sarcosine-3u-12]PKG36615.1 hypothetical protein CXF65_01635 [Psychrobacter sp. Sarcosine-3u-12]
MSEQIWSKEYSFPPVKARNIIYAIILILIPNIIFLVISIITETSRPLINIDYVIPVLLILLKRPLYKWVGVIALSVLTISDVTMFIFQLFPFMDLEGALYLAPFFLQAPTRYIVFVLVILIYAIALPVSIKSFSRPIDNYHLFLASGIVLLLSYFFSVNGLRYKEGSGTTFGSHNNYFAASQTSILFSIQDMRFVQKASIAPSFTPTKYKRVASMLERPYNNKILFIVVESLGVAKKSDVQNKIIEPITSQQHLLEFYKNGIYQAPDSTIKAEIKELCAQDLDGYGLRMVAESEFPSCLPKYLADKGYRTAALHGANGKLYDRFSWYNKAGFKDVKFSENLFEARRCKAFNGICDDEVFPIIQSYFEKNEPSFFYWMTLTAHATYAQKDIYNKRLDCESYGIKDNETCRNMMLQAQFFESLAKLNSQPEMKGVEVVLIGDHQPPITNGIARFREYDYPLVTWLHYKIK